MLYLTGRYSQLVVFYRESVWETTLNRRKGIDATCADNLKESVYYVKALVHEERFIHIQTHLGDALLVRDTARRIVESMQMSELSRAQQSLVAELFFMLGQQLELDSMDEAIRA